MELFADPSELTLEGVPPKSVGGRKLLLTCNHCNSSGGFEVDNHWAIEDTARRFASDTLAQTTKAEVVIGDGQVAATLAPSNGKVAISLAQNAINPDKFHEYSSLLEAMINNAEGTITCAFGRMSDRRAQISRLRAAYLASFAMLGYKYIKSLNHVRFQVANPDKPVISNFHIDTGSESPWNILVGEIHGIGRCFVVQLGRDSILLPPESLEDDGEFWRMTARVGASGTPFDFSGGALHWPAKPEYFFDLYGS